MDRESIITRVKADTGIDTTEVTTLCQYHIDRVQDRICSGMYYENNDIKTHDFSFLTDYAAINLTPTYSTGTVAITQDSTSVTGTTTVWTSDHVGWYMKVAGTDDWYEISAVGGNTDITFASAFIGETVTTATYVLYKIKYALDSNFKQMKWMTQIVTPQRITPITELETADIFPDPYAQSGEIKHYIHSGEDSSGNRLVRFIPIQTARRRVYYGFEKNMTTANATGASSAIPTKWHMLFVFGLSEVVWRRHDRANNAQEAKDNFNEMMLAFVKEDKKISKDRITAMSDELVYSGRNYPEFPSAYPINYSR